ncbi:MAG: hypothetical protein WAO61_09445 [Solirubrobacterales bacterium]
MSEEMTTQERQIYRETATVFEYTHGLFETGKLNVETLDEALALGEAYFADKCKRGEISENWRDIAYAELIT